MKLRKSPVRNRWQLVTRAIQRANDSERRFKNKLDPILTSPPVTPNGKI